LDLKNGAGPGGPPQAQSVKSPAMAAEMNNGKRPRFVNFFIVFLIFLGVISVCTIAQS